MFSRLPESNAVRQRRAGGLVVSTLVHALVIALAVRATMLTAAPRPNDPSPRPPVYVAPPERVPTTQRTPPPQRNSVAPTTSAPTMPDIPQPIITPDVPTTIPDLGATILHGSDGFSRTTSMSGPESTGGAPNAADGSPLTERFVEKVVVALPGTAPRYPDMLRQAGVEGDVRAQFVVDTLGRVEPGSVRVLEATHDQFAAAVRTALSSRARFKPAEAGGHKVRQLVEQTFTFRLDGKD
jgi:periplasmic protein TonB